LGNLEQRVNQQKIRLKKWQDFHGHIMQRSRKLGHDKPKPPSDTSSRPVFNFDRHKELHLGIERNGFSKEIPSSAILDGIVSDMKRGLMSTSAASSHRSSSEFGNAITKIESPVSPRRSDIEFSLLARAGKENNMRRTISGDYSNRDTTHVSTSVTAVPLSRIFSPAKPFLLNRNGSGSVPSLSVNNAPLQSINESPHVPTRSEKLESNGVATQHTIAGSQREYDEPADIVSSVVNAQMTPIPESRMSLADRTRLSMAQANSGFQSISNPNQPKPAEEIFTATSVIAAGPSVADRRASLLERTQQSMSNATSAQKPNLRKSISMKKQRQSLYPVNQFETPGRHRMEPIRDTTPTEKLFSGEADYASVFKSRPRVQLSPQPSPNGDDLPVATNTLDEINEYEYEDEDSFVRSSPLRGRG
jgi:hypothetical protein